MKPKCRVSPTESEYEMELEQLMAHLDVQTNILNEAKRERELRERGVRAIAEASNRESQ